MMLATIAALTMAINEVPFRIGEDAIIVDALVNGKKLSLLFDTGFSGSVVCDDNINLGVASGSMTLRDFVGQFEAKTVKIKSLKLGDTVVDSTGMEAVQQPSAHMSESYNTHTDGIMGFEVIRSNITEINFQNKKFIFHPKTLDVSKRVPDGKRTFLLKMLPIGNNSIEGEVVAANGKKMILALDTGNAFFATTHKDVLERIGLWDSKKTPQFMKSSFVASGEVASWYKHMPDLTIFGVPVKSSVWSIIDLPSSSAEGDGTVGFGFLKNFNITIDFERRRVWLENFTGETGNVARGEVGITAGYDPRSSRVRVFRVAPESPAAKAGVKVGDAVLSIDDLEIATQGFRTIEKALEGEPGSKVRIALSRGGNLTRVEMERAVLIND
jgi:predicted aspartyl protease